MSWRNIHQLVLPHHSIVSSQPGVLDTHGRIADHKINRTDEMLLWRVAAAAL